MPEETCPTIKIPNAMQTEKRWVCWNSEGGRKKPRRADNGELAKSNDPDTWATYAEATAAVEAYGYSGVGFCLGDGFAGVDLDDVRDPESGELTAEAEQIIRQLDTYAEVSPSKTGVKLFLTGEDLPTQGTKRPLREEGQIEFYSEVRYFAVTGDRLSDAPGEQRLLALCDLLPRGVTLGLGR